SLLSGATAEPTRVKVRGADGRERMAYPVRFLLDDEGSDRFRFGFARQEVVSQRLDLSVGYVALPDFQEARVAEMERALASLRDLPLLLLDLRGNPGGRIRTLQRIAGLFFEGPRAILQLHENGAVETMRSIPGAVRYAGRVRVLVDERTGSAAELLAAALQDLDRGTVYGKPTAGSARSRESAVLPGGVIFHYAAAAEFKRIGGRPLEGLGVIPDVIVSPTRAELAGGGYGNPRRDAVVRRARG
ncbi:MAG: S41 family peptidase, partial [Planctomycetota bacterium]